MKLIFRLLDDGLTLESSASQTQNVNRIKPFADRLANAVVAMRRTPEDKLKSKTCKRDRARDLGRQMQDQLQR